ncbi:hypothetical protein D4764_02G0005750 [Takifugu flavidus]|uniref:Reverse transcriptase domain-containing protein n=1 Tax=Takifugu flavidus TaxID=433684 RepID=A0A5C6NJA3_9TELE|nr:hypothetical protein D4764_02G0005750 [Takifugu flavidus]
MVAYIGRGPTENMTKTLATSIKPSTPSDNTMDLIWGNAKNWAVTTLLILRDHYLEQPTGHGIIWEDAFSQRRWNAPRLSLQPDCLKKIQPHFNPNNQASHLGTPPTQRTGLPPPTLELPQDTTSPNRITYRPIYHIARPNRKVQDWSFKGRRPILILGDSNIKRIPGHTNPNIQLDSYPGPLSTLHPSYIKDTYHFISTIQPMAVPTHSILFTLDIDSLYTNIDTTLGLQALHRIFNQHPDPTRPDKELLQLIELCLKNNDFLFNQQYYLQTHGTAMGQRFAPSYANLYMSEWEREALSKCPLRPILYLRYLDDVFGIWTYTIPQFMEFINTLNTIIHPSNSNTQ